MCLCVRRLKNNSFDFTSPVGNLSCPAMMSVDVTNHNGPAATPPTSLSLRSSHNQLLDSDAAQQGSATPPKCRKKYALTSIQSAMGLGEGVSAPPSPASSPPQPSNPSNPKVAKNGANQLRKAGQDHNKNTTALEPTDLPPSPEAERDGGSFSKAEENGFLTPAANGTEGGIFKVEAEWSPDPHRDREAQENAELHIDSNINTTVELKLSGNSLDPCLDMNVEADESDDISILSEKEMMLKMKIEEDGDELAVEEPGDEEKNPLLVIKSESAVKNNGVSSGLVLLSDLQSNFKLLRSVNDSPGPPPPSSPKQASPEDMPLLSVAPGSPSCSSSSSPETKKDRRTGAKTDCALNRIQNLNPSDEELSWTTLSQESNSPEETGTHTFSHKSIEYILYRCILTHTPTYI